MPTTIVLSPHYDDAVLSTGGLIARLSDAGDHVVVVDICTGVPVDGFSPFAEDTHRLWKLPPAEVLVRRRAEDSAALAIVGADRRELGALDAIYRLPDRYASNRTLFGAVVADDPLPEAILRGLAPILDDLPGATILAPLGIGRHVDHQAAFQAACQLRRERRVLFYEDAPYVYIAGAAARRLTRLDLDLTPILVDIRATIDRKVEAIGCYASQIQSLFGTPARLNHAVRRYAGSIAGVACERYWVPRG